MNGAQHRIKIATDLMGRDAQQPNAVLSHPPVPLPVASRPLFVDPAINLDDQARRRAKEVGHIWPDRLLPTKLQPAKPAIAQFRPEHTLRR